NGIDTICTVDILNNSGAIVETYTKHMTGWNQINYISLLHDGNVGYGVGNNDRRYIRFRFKHDQKTTALRNTVVNKIRIFSFTKYSFPTDRFMGHTGHIYNFDYNMNTYFPNSILAKGGVTAYQSSDIRLKQDLRKLDYLGIIKAMGGTYGFAWKKDNTRSIGWIAQHVLCNPHLKDIVETDEKGYYKINYWSPKLIATAFGAIEQVGDEVSRLK
ncbi:tail fiber domain-containing protein, partial [Enterococcus faecium]